LTERVEKDVVKSRVEWGQNRRLKEKQEDM